jgi:autotransporter-associated beta strand protein
VALAFGGFLPASAIACQITITGTQAGFNNSAPVDCISISNASVAGNVNNSGSVLQNGITVSNSTLNGALSNVGLLAGGNIATLVGGISADNKSSIGGGGPLGIAVIGVPNFAGGISTGATIAANNGVYLDNVSSFAGGIINGGQITAGNGFSISNISSFSGGATNSGQISATNYGMSFLNIADFGGGIFNSGTITSTGVNRAGISLFIGSYAGGITNTGNISAVGAGITLGDLLCACSPQLSFAGGISNRGNIQGGFAGIAIADPTAFSGTIVNSGNISGVTGLVLFYSGAGGISVLNSGTITGTGGTAIEFGSPGTLTLTSTSVINGTILGNGSVLQLGGSSAGAFDVSALGAQYQSFVALNMTGGSTWTLSGTSAFSGPVNVNNGTLLLIGSIPSASATVNTGATLGGNGTIGDTVVNGGTLAAGGLHVQGNLLFTTGSAYRVDVTSMSSSLTDVTGTATLGGTVQVSSQNNSYRFNSPHEIISSSGSNGTQFNSVTAPTGISPSLSYANGDVFLNLVSNLGQVGTLNQRAVGAALDPLFNSNQPSAPGAIFWRKHSFKPHSSKRRKRYWLAANYV